MFYSTILKLIAIYSTITTKNRVQLKKSMKAMTSHFSKDDIQMTKKCMERYSISLQINTMMRYHLTRIRMASSKKPTSFGEDVEKLESSYSVVETVEWHSHYGKKYGSSSKQLRLELQCNPIVILVGIHSKELKAAP